jgi:hypothetical protein
VVIALADTAVSDPSALAADTEPIDGGQAMVLDGANGRTVFQRAIGQDAMAIATAASERDGRVDRDLIGADCPTATGAGGHAPPLMFAFAETQDESAGGLYTDGPVIHAYIRAAAVSATRIAGSPHFPDPPSSSTADGSADAVAAGAGLASA